MKSYQIKNLQKELAKRTRIANAIKGAIQAATKTYSKNDLIRRYNVEVRVIKSVRSTLLAELEGAL